MRERHDVYWFEPSAVCRADAAHIGLVIERFSTGGSERVAITLANHWAASGREVTIWCAHEEGPVRALVSPTIAVREVPCDGGRRAFGRAVARAIGPRVPDVLVCPGNYHLPILASLGRALGARAPALVAKLSNPICRKDRSRLRQVVFELGLRRATSRFDRIVAMSPVLAEEARDVLCRHNVACLAEPTLLAPAPPRRAVPSGLVLAIGRLAQQKNLTLALEAFALARCDARLVVLGEGPDYGALRDRAAELGLGERVRFVGFVEDVGPWLAAADALLCSSHFEGYPAALVEALSAGVPVVTTPCSAALPAIMTDASCGAIVPAQATALAEALDDVLATGRAPSEQARLKLMRRHDAGQAAAAWLSMLDATVAARRDRGSLPERAISPAAPTIAEVTERERVPV